MEKTQKVMEKNHGIFCNLKSMNPASVIFKQQGKKSFD